MEPGLTRFESEQPNVKYTHINIDEKDQPANKELFTKYFKGAAIPYTVLVAENGEARLNWTGKKSYEQLVEEIQAVENGTAEQPSASETPESLTTPDDTAASGNNEEADSK